MEAGEIEARIAGFARWNYRFQFENGVSTPVQSPAVVNRHEQRRRYFFDALVGLCGGSLRGRRVLDLGCNSGFWALAALEAGADFVLGVDAQPVYIEQAELVFTELGVDPERYSFKLGNIFEQEFAERFDVVLCLGLIDQVSRPLELFEVLSRAAGELIVIETEVSRSRLPVFEVSRVNQQRNIIDHSLVLIPSRSAVIELAGEFGFKTAPLALNISNYAALQDYRRKRRLAFICARTISLDGVEQEPPAPLVPWWVRDPRALIEAYV
jgi:SAM-dependent methyltransferase